MRTRVKFCGITNTADLAAAVLAGADALGFQMFEKSPRHISKEVAAEFVASLPPFVTSVGLFVNQPAKDVREIADAADFDILQFHGDETEPECLSAGRPYIKVIRVNAKTDIEQEVGLYPSADAILLDAKVEGLYGGTGETFDWSIIPAIGKPIVLAGGLNCENVGTAIRIARPYAVDLCSGVELKKGKKDAALMTAFVEAVHSGTGK